MGRENLLAVVVVWAATWGLPAAAAAQASVHKDDGTFEYVMTVDQLVYGLFDSVHVSYSVTNITETRENMNVCCCGVEFFAVRDSSCVFGADTCEVAGCDACPVCFDGDGCSFDPCSPISIPPDSTVEFRWDWAREVCPEDFGADPLFGNVGTFRIVTGYHVCDGGDYANRLEMGITVTTRVATLPTTWGSLKTRHVGDAIRARPPG